MEERNKRVMQVGRDKGRQGEKEDRGGREGERKVRREWEESVSRLTNGWTEIWMFEKIGPVELLSICN